MKVILVFAVLLLFHVTTTIGTLAKSETIVNTTGTLAYGIEDGWYEANVKYANYQTSTYRTYTLDVKVQYNRVVAIDFGNGGSVHTGYNNSGYTYSGGTLYFETNYAREIIAATTTVTIFQGNQTQRFDIRIE